VKTVTKYLGLGDVTRPAVAIVDELRVLSEGRWVSGDGRVSGGSSR